MKRISAVICELNPLHDGHRYVFKTAREQSDMLIAVMSGNFVQRGECAVYDKYRRAREAIAAGADLVFELAFPFSASSAEFFSAAGVSIAEAVGATDLYFGSECADADKIRRAAEILDRATEYMPGRAAAQREERLKCGGVDLPRSLLSCPNDILATEYCRRTRLNIHPIKRTAAESSAEIRARIYKERGEDGAVYPELLLRLMFDHFRTATAVGEYAESGGGVANRLYKTAFETNDPERWMQLCATKQYTNARLRRAALFEVCAVTDDMLREAPEYTAVLAANSNGRKYLGKMRKSFALQVITNPSEGFSLPDGARRQFEKGVFADSLYTMCAGLDDPAYFVKKIPYII